MPLLDHFRPPLSLRRHWESFLASWAVSVAEKLSTTLLPKRYFAELHFRTGNSVEIDLSTPDYVAAPTHTVASSPDGTATLTAPVWAPPAPAAVIPAVFPDELEVLVFNDEGGPTLVAAL